MNILITGGAGFIGSHLVEYHLGKGDKVHVVDDLSTGSQENINLFKNNPNFQFAKADILTWPDLEKSIKQADRIYHMAAVVGVYHVLEDPVKVLETNIAGSERIFQTVAKADHKPQILLASTSEVYGHSSKPTLNEEDNLIMESGAHTRWSYAISKLADEALAAAYFHKINLKVTIVRLFNTVGPRQVGRYGMVVPRFIDKACKGEPITVFGDGNQTRSFCDVRDTVVVLDLLAGNPSSYGNVVNVGNDRETSINQLAELIRERAKSQSDIQHISYKEAYHEEYVDIQRRRPDLNKLFNLTSFKHQWTLEKTIDDLIARYR